MPEPGRLPEDTRIADETALAHVRTMWAQDAASAALGIECVALSHDGETGHARARMTITQEMVNGHGIAHGGYVFTFADSTFALACNAGGRLTVASGGDITFVASARLGDVLEAEGTELAVWGRSGLTDIRVMRPADGALIAHYRGRSRALPPRN